MALDDDLRAPESARESGRQWLGTYWQSRWFRVGFALAASGSVSLLFCVLDRDGDQSPTTDPTSKVRLAMALVGITIVLLHLRGRRRLMVATCMVVGLTTMVTLLELDARRGPEAPGGSVGSCVFDPQKVASDDPHVCVGPDKSNLRVQATGFRPGSLLTVELRGADLRLTIGNDGTGAATTRQGRGHAHLRGVTATGARFRGTTTLYRYPGGAQYVDPTTRFPR